ncbi:hypothetical protein LTR37_002926 [Vermiconidia calcicola]|uniref:Uncharacterized protein n=1 Tax=Vermiconidia calcicola TaxID=1690605 RepID=A0ACC3NSD4_9PEZI|nr:hypothetical protein LTR37_002926 [Vermiconidia calcicola]
MLPYDSIAMLFKFSISGSGFLSMAFSNAMIPRRRFLPRRQSLPHLSQVQRNWPVTGALSSNHQLVYRFAPYLAHSAHQCGMTLDAAAREFCYSSEDIEENGGLPGLSMRDLMETYDFFIQTLQSSVNERDVSTTIEQFLERTHIDDERRIDGYGQLNHSRSLGYFRALAEISYRTRSTRLATFLSTYFLSKGRELLIDKDTDKVALWSYAVYRLRVPSEARRACQTLILEERYEILDALRSYNIPHLQGLRRALEKVAADLGVMDISSRGRGGQRYDRRDLFLPSISPHRQLDRFRSRALPTSRDMIRARSAPGDRQIARQADRVTDVAESLIIEAERLKDLTIDY